MSDIDRLASGLFEESKRFLELSRKQIEASKKTPYLHAAILVAFCSLEAHVNAMADDFLSLEQISVLDRSILAERRVELNDGRFEVMNQLQIYRLEDRLLYLCHNFSKTTMDKGSQHWSDFKAAVNLRNSLTHPKTPPVVDEAAVERALQAILEILNFMYKSIYGKKYPAVGRGLDSNLEF